eukprot:TRINITY_DN82400_c0_g1_i1.p1 TRINITY_DN82400_c0_g1~~TRINITY_DN82400_c0_g1_i1.p1  ORF type:complete len:145 (+),score=70.15 TRINITY_DN82400_c0_g1_i1:97-531(+)
MFSRRVAFLLAALFILGCVADEPKMDEDGIDKNFYNIDDDEKELLDGEAALGLVEDLGGFDGDLTAQKQADDDDAEDDDDAVDDVDDEKASDSDEQAEEQGDEDQAEGQGDEEQAKEQGEKQAGEQAEEQADEDDEQSGDEEDA